MRWTVLFLLFVATTINYMDRQILAILAPVLEAEIRWTEAEYGFIVTGFQAAYALGMLAFGPIVDRLGVQRGYVLSIAWWSLAAMGHAVARTPLGFGCARFLLGFGEAGNFPAAVKTVTEWFSERERAFAVGLFNCGSNIGAIVTPLLVPWIAKHYGWRWAFTITGSVGLLWILAWVMVPRPPRRPAETAERGANWMELLRQRPTWALLIARFLTDPVWWFYLYWTPKFLHSQHGITLDGLGPPLIAVYLAADAGSVFGGWLSSFWIRRGWSVNRARKMAILICALLVVPVGAVSRVDSLWTAVICISLAAAGHQGWAANMFAMISDIYPARAVSSATGVAGFGGAIGGMLASTAVGLTLQWTGSYVPVFLWASVSYLVVLGVIHAMVPVIGARPGQAAPANAG